MDDIKELKSSENATDVKSFLKLCDVFRRLVQSFARKLLPPEDKIRKGYLFSFDLDDKERDAMKRLLPRLISPRVVALPYAEMRLILDVNASEDQIRFVSM